MARCFAAAPLFTVFVDGCADPADDDDEAEDAADDVCVSVPVSPGSSAATPPARPPMTPAARSRPPTSRFFGRFRSAVRCHDGSSPAGTSHAAATMSTAVAGPEPAPPTWVASEASRTAHSQAASAADGRSAGSLDSAFSTTPRRAVGTPSRSASPDITRKATTSGAPAPNGSRPVAA
ncbi:hypothetical protein ABZ876_17335 [Streptomyces sp. NPDC046931]|uniref:hypothetical protein n=1 Tax=Streptomyces sp. NPDC046931 TaxID=3154806 RepID=UPI0033E8658D